MSNYKTFTGAFAKVFLGAVLTYQIIYWTWLKLETDESRLEKNGIVFSSYLRICYSPANCISRGNGELGEEGAGIGGCPEMNMYLALVGGDRFCRFLYDNSFYCPKA
jgi:hypothetical protein